MCGIGFFVNYHPTKNMNIDLVGEVFRKLQARGTDASGFYFERPSATKEEKAKHGAMNRQIFKAPLKASDLWEISQGQERFTSKIQETKALQGMNKEEIKEFNEDKEFYLARKMNGKERVIIMHTRAKTQGSPLMPHNVNNHPLVSNSQFYVLVHNGMIWDSDKVKGYKYRGECDSEHILANIEVYGLSKGLKRTAGSLAIILKKMENDYLYLYRNNNPLDIVYLAKEQLLIGASSDIYIPDNNEDYTFNNEVFNPPRTESSLPENRLYRVNTKKNATPRIEYIEEIKISSTTRIYNSIKSWQDKQKTVKCKLNKQVYLEPTTKVWKFGEFNG